MGKDFDQVQGKMTTPMDSKRLAKPLLLPVLSTHHVIEAYSRLCEGEDLSICAAHQEYVRLNKQCWWYVVRTSPADTEWNSMYIMQILMDGNGRLTTHKTPLASFFSPTMVNTQTATAAATQRPYGNTTNKDQGIRGTIINQQKTQS